MFIVSCIVVIDSVKKKDRAMQNYTIDADQLMYENIDSEIIIIHIETGNYHSLRFVAGDIWQMLESQYTTQQIIDTLTEIYPDQKDNITEHVKSMLQSLADENIIQLTDANTPSTDKLAIVKQDNGYTAPEVETYTDFQGLLLVDPIHDVAQEGWPQVADSQDE